MHLLGELLLFVFRKRHVVANFFDELRPVLEEEKEGEGHQNKIERTGDDISYPAPREAEKILSEFREIGNDRDPELRLCYAENRKYPFQRRLDHRVPGKTDNLLCRVFKGDVLEFHGELIRHVGERAERYDEDQNEYENSREAPHLEIPQEEIVNRVKDNRKHDGPSDRHKEGPEYQIRDVSKQQDKC